LFVSEAWVPCRKKSGFKVDLESKGLQKVWGNILVVFVLEHPFPEFGRAYVVFGRKLERNNNPLKGTLREGECVSCSGPGRV
jgi:hypothetical protein